MNIGSNLFSRMDTMGTTFNSFANPNCCGPDTLQIEKLATGKRRIARNTTVYRKNDRLRMLYFVRFGQFKMISGELNALRIVGFPMAGELLGLDAIATEKHNFCLMALENSEVYEIPFAEIAKTTNVASTIHSQLLQTMSTALNNEYSRSVILAMANLDERFAAFLMNLGEKYSRLGYSDKTYRLSMSRSDIGSYLGTTNESVSRLIARFNAQGSVSIRGRMVQLLDRTYLQALLSGDERTVIRSGSRHAADH